MHKPSWENRFNPLPLSEFPGQSDQALNFEIYKPFRKKSLLKGISLFNF